MLPVFYAQRRCAPLPVTTPLPRHRPSAYEPKSCARFARPLRPRLCPHRHTRPRLALPRLRVRDPSRRHAGRSLCPRPRWRRRAYFQRPRPVSAHARPAPRTSHTRTNLGTAPCSACPSRPALSADPFRPTSTTFSAIPSFYALPPASCPPALLLASAHTLVFSTEGVSTNHTAVREHRIDLPALNRIIAPGDASRTNAEAQRRPNPVLQPVRGAAPAPWILPIYYAALPPADPAALATVPHRGRVLVRSGLCGVRSSAFLGVFVIIYQGASFVSSFHQECQRGGRVLVRSGLCSVRSSAFLGECQRGGRVLVRSGLCSVRSSAFLGVFVIIYQDTDFVPYAALLSCFYLPKTIVYVVAWAVEVLANVGRASGVRDGRQRKASRASPATLRLPPAVFLLITVRASDHTHLAPHTAGEVFFLKKIIGFFNESDVFRSSITPPIHTTLWFGRSKVSFESGGRAEAVDRVLAKQPAHRSRGTIGPASPQVACSSLSKAAITLLLNRRTITYFDRLELSLALEGHAEAAEWEEAKVRPRASSPLGYLFGVAVDVTLPRSSPADLPFSFTRPAPRRAELGASDDVPTPFKLFRGLICVSAGGLGRWAPIPASAPQSTRYALPTPTLFRTRRILQHIFYFFIVCPPIPTLDEHFWIDVQAPTGVSLISPCDTQGDFFKEPSPITPHSIPPSPKVPGWTFER
ncbi:hypothetical protein B0H14DRAFT_3775415 [Mycena olivaceomarginata]|nr:hypothetical protein B0H14DRAFT_3775415 [Mycena olivaceomarginata]